MDKPDFATQDVTAGDLNALVKNIMAQMGIRDANEAVRLINSGEWVITKVNRPWREENNVIYFSVTSDGTTGEEWITRLENKGLRVSDYAKSVLRSKAFKPTSGVTTEVAVLKGELFADSDRITKKIRSEATSRKLLKPNAEIGCLIRETFSDKEIEAMGLTWIVAMHKPIKDSDGDPGLLFAHRNGGGRWLSAYCDYPGLRWDRESGFAFAVSQVSA
jgi:hypothetical protein